MYYSKTFFEDTVVVRVRYKEEEVYLTFEDTDFIEVINMRDGNKYDMDTVSDIMYDMLVSLESDDEGMVFEYRVEYSIRHPEWIGYSGEWA